MITENRDMDILQAAIIMGKKPKEIKVGDSVRLDNAEGEIVAIEGNNVTMKVTSLMGANASVVDVTSFLDPRGDSPTMSTTPRFNVLDIFDAPNPETEKPMGGYPPFSKPRTGPMSKFPLPDNPGSRGEVAGQGEKRFTFPKGELKSPRPTFRRSPAPREPSPDVRHSRDSEAAEILSRLDTGGDSQWSG